MYLLMKGLRMKGKLGSKKVEMLYKLAWGMCTAAVARSHSVIGSMIHYHPEEWRQDLGKYYGQCFI